VLFSTLAALVLAEAGLRLAVHVGVPRILADPGRYANPLSDDAYWILRAKGGLQPPLRRHTEHEQDPLLGWVPDRRNLNPMGGWQSPRFPEGTTETVAVFGDSFVFGTVGDGERLPDHLQAALTGTRVLNYGVAGYGLDQITARFDERLGVLERAAARVVVGILTTDLDRCLLTVRSGPKPTVRADGSLDPTRRSDLDQSHDTFFARARGPVSLVAALVRRSLTPVDAHRPQVERVGKAVLERLDGLCRQAVACQLVVFEGPEEVVRQPGWRVEMIAEHTTAPMWLARDALGTEPLRSYGADRHLNAQGNRTVARALAELLGPPR